MFHLQRQRLQNHNVPLNSLQKQSITASAIVPAIYCNSSGKQCHIELRRRSWDILEPGRNLSLVYGMNYVYHLGRALPLLLTSGLTGKTSGSDKPRYPVLPVCCGESSDLKLYVDHAVGRKLNMGRVVLHDTKTARQTTNTNQTQTKPKDQLPAPNLPPSQRNLFVHVAFKLPQIKVRTELVGISKKKGSPSLSDLLQRDDEASTRIIPHSNEVTCILNSELAKKFEFGNTSEEKKGEGGRRRFMQTSDELSSYLLGSCLSATRSGTLLEV
ncbi:hypothetical protein Tco_0482630 [Tanacetum coccineum]